MKSKAEYRERGTKYMIDACFSWARLSKEKQAWYASKGISMDAYMRKYSRDKRRIDRLHHYIKKHGMLPLRKGIGIDYCATEANRQNKGV